MERQVATEWSGPKPVSYETVGLRVRLRVGRKNGQRGDPGGSRPPEGGAPPKNKMMNYHLIFYLSLFIVKSSCQDVVVLVGILSPLKPAS